MLVPSLNLLMPGGRIRTLQSQPENGKPRSRANANICLDAVATLLMALQRVNSVMMQVITVVPA